MTNILKNWIGNKAGSALTKLRRTQLSHRSADWWYHLLPAGISHKGADLGFMIAFRVGCHPLIMSHIKFKSDFMLAMLMGEVSSFRLFSV